MPDSADLYDRQYYLTVSAVNGSMEFLKNQFVSLGSAHSRGYLFVKTDKPIYKPSQTGNYSYTDKYTTLALTVFAVKFCVVSMDVSLVPHTAKVSCTVGIIIGG